MAAFEHSILADSHMHTEQEREVITAQLVV